jgi:prepilin-type processing-associated H-X9-DG protein
MTDQRPKPEPAWKDITQITGDLVKPYMSQNHTKGEEINVLYADTHVARHKRPDGGINKDNIYTIGGPAGTATGQGTNVDPEDSYLIGPYGNK